ncbi:MAG: ABC transporter substrate-binding protein [Thermoplasmata archaeon]
MSLNAPSATSPPRRTVAVSWFIVGLLVVAGVAIAGTAAYTSLRSATSPNSPVTPGNLSVTDDLGRTVTVPYDPARVVVLSPNVNDVMFRLGLRSHVVGIDCYAAAEGGISEDYSPDQIALWNLASSMCVQVGPAFAPEMLVNLTPELVLASTIVSVAEVETITSTLHIPVVMLQPPTLSGILVDVSLLGEIFGVSSLASSLNARLSLELANVTTIDNNLYALPTVLLTYSVDSNGYWTFGPGTFGESLVDFAGATSIAANSTTPYPELSPAQVLVADPSVIVYGVGFGLNESTYAGGPLWSSFSAVQAGNATGIDSNWFTEPDPTMILSGIPALLAIFHPGLS